MGSRKLSILPELSQPVDHARESVLASKKPVKSFVFAVSLSEATAL